ncbi:MAG TPA: hypothetical protein VNW73_16530 [Ktedonobacteraceae bacterium]|nr:hypothetical protein [Ktedonobacteraceae bacterium]
MAEVYRIQTSPSKRANRRKITLWVIALVCLGGLVISLIASMGIQFTSAKLPPRLILEKDIPLPGAFPDDYRTPQDPFAPGLAVLFDHFDFQALDPQTHLLFIADSGPATDREQQVNPNFNPDTDAKTDGNIVVFDTKHYKVVGLLNIPQVAGIVVAPDLQQVYAADSNDNLIYSIDERTLKYHPIKLQDNDSPDGVAYDVVDHLIIVSNPGTPPTLDSNIIDRKNQNETIINALTDTVVARIPLGIDGKWGDDVGHVKYDPGLHRAFVVVQQLPDPDDPNPNLLPPPGTAWLVEIDPPMHRVVSRMKLPYLCLTPHGVALDTEQHIAFIASVDETPPSMVRVDTQALAVISEQPWPLELKPDIIMLDTQLHMVFVGCGVGLAVFQEEGRNLKSLGYFNYGINMHTVAVNEETHELYLPLTRVGNRPVLRIMRYNPQPSS